MLLNIYYWFKRQRVLITKTNVPWKFILKVYANAEVYILAKTVHILYQHLQPIYPYLETDCVKQANVHVLKQIFLVTLGLKLCMQNWRSLR